jgi:hypothetical protein
MQNQRLPRPSFDAAAADCSIAIEQLMNVKKKTSSPHTAFHVAFGPFSGDQEGRGRRLERKSSAGVPF